MNYRNPAVFAALFLITGCMLPPAPPPAMSRDEEERELIPVSDQDTYSLRDMGRAQLVEYGTVVRVREVGVATAGIGRGKAYRSQDAYDDRSGEGTMRGMEYVVVTRSGKSFSIVQRVDGSDRVYGKGDHVMLQFGGGYQRLLPAEHLPSRIKRPVGVDMDNF